MAESSLNLRSRKACLPTTEAGHHPSAGGERYVFGDLVVDAGSGAVKRGDTVISLSRLTFELLLTLARRAPATVNRQELLETVWPNEFVNDDTLSQRVRHLREALGDVTDEPRYVQSVRGWGYRLVPVVERVKEEALPIRAIAVLPLENLGDPEQEYFADGMTDTLISVLARISALKIISRTSVMRYRHAGKNLPQIGRELGVDAVVEGTVLTSSGRVRVSVQLIRAATDEHIWAEIYDRQLEDVLDLHADLAKSIADAIRVAVTPLELERLGRHRRVNPAAHELELRARYFGAKFTPADLDRAIRYCEDAIAADPLRAEARSGMATACFARSGPLSGDLDVRIQHQLLGRGKAEAEAALAIDDTLAEAHCAFGAIVLFHEWDFKAAERAFDRALELDSNSLTHMYRAFFASTVLDGARVIAEMRLALELDPLNLLLRTEAAEYCYWIREYELAIAYASETLDLEPSFPRAHFVIGRVREAQGNILEAIAEYHRAGVIRSGAELAVRAFQEFGPAGYHRWALQAGLTIAPHLPGAIRGRPYFRARAHARLGELDEAMRFLEEAFEQRECLMALLKAHEWWDPLRTDPRFTELVRRVGIP